MQQPNAHDVAEHYDSATSRLASILFEGHMHLGWWDTQTAGGSNADAARRFTREMVARASIRPGQRFVDLGCGVGMPAIALAQATGCSVDGITISRFQQGDATARAAAAGLAERVRFHRADALDPPLPAASYDGGWFFESIFHMGHQPALAAAARLLKPGAELLVADLTLRDDASPRFIGEMERMMVSRFVRAADYPQLLADAGFDLLDCEDVSPQVMPHLVPRITETIAQHRALILEQAGQAAIDGALASYAAMSENLDYVLVRARRR